MLRDCASCPSEIPTTIPIKQHNGVRVSRNNQPLPSLASSHRCAIPQLRLSRTVCQHVCAHVAFSVRGTALPRMQEFDVGLIHFVHLTPAGSPMAVVCPVCRSSETVQQVFIATTWLRSQSRVQRSSSKCFVRDLDHRPYDRYACANTSSPTDRAQIVVSNFDCRRLQAVQRILTAAVWPCWQSQSGSLNSWLRTRQEPNSFVGDLLQRSYAAPTTLLDVGCHSGLCTIRENPWKAERQR